MPIDSLIRLRQLNNPEVSGYILDVTKRYLGTGTGISVSNTGSLTGEFYPRKTNPSGYVTGSVVRPSDTGAFVDDTDLAVSTASILTQVSGLYYRQSNPSGFMTKASGDVLYAALGPTINSGQLIFDDTVNAGYAFHFVPNKSYALRGTGTSLIDFYNPTGALITGFSINSSDIKLNGKTVLNDASKYLHTDATDAKTYNTETYLYDSTITSYALKFNEATEFLMSGRSGALIDFYDSTRNSVRPYISGFDIYTSGLYINGINITGLTGGAGGGTGDVTYAQLTGVSGELDADIQSLRSETSGILKRIGYPTGDKRSDILYLNTNPAAYIEKGYKAYSNPQEIFDYMVTGGSGLYKIVVGTGDFAPATFSGHIFTSPATRFDLGEVSFVNEFNTETYSPFLRLKFQNTNVRVRFDGGIYTYLTGYSGKMSFDCGAPFAKTSEKLPNIVLTAVTGSINGFGLDNVLLAGACDIDVDNCQVNDFFLFSQLSGLDITNSEITTVFPFKTSWFSHYTVENSVIGQTTVMSSPSNGIITTFSGITGKVSPTSSYILDVLVPSGWGGLSYATTGLALLSNTGGGFIKSDRIITKTTGDLLYYSVSNPSSYTTQAYVAANYASIPSVVLLGNSTQNTSLYLTHSGTNVTTFDSAKNTFIIRDASGKGQINVFGNNPVTQHRPFISGYNLTGIPFIDVTSQIYISGVPISVALNGAQTGILTGEFYPLKTNPSGYLVSDNLTPYLLRSETGDFIVVNDPRDITLLGKLTANQLAAGSGLTVTGPTSLEDLDANDVTFESLFVNTTLTVSGPVDFSSKITFSGDTPIVKGNTGVLANSFVAFNQTGAFYPRSGNPSGFIGTSQTGLFVSTGESRATTTKTLTVTGTLSLTSAASLDVSGPANFVGTVGISTLNVGGQATFTGPASFSSSVSVSGQPLVTGHNSSFVLTGQTGAYTNTFPTHTQTGTLLVGKNQTGFFTGEFYPYKSNPSGYLTAGNTGAFITTGQTGAFAPRSDVVMLTGLQTISGNKSFAGYTSLNGGFQFFEGMFSDNSWTAFSNSNAISVWSGALTGNWSAQSMTISGASVVTSNQTGILVGENETGVYTNTFPTHTQTGTLLVGKNQTGIYSGSFYPLNSNPSGYVKSTETGILVGENETGAYTNTFPTHTQTGTLLVGKNNTGFYTGEFYPRKSNPSGYLTSVDLSPYVLDSETGNFVTLDDPRDIQFLGKFTANQLFANSGLQVTGPTSLEDLVATDVIFNTLSLNGSLTVSGPASFVSGVTISGHTVVTKNDTGALQNSFVNYSETGAFYPRLSNPSGYVRASETGILVGENETGAYVNTFPTHTQTGNLLVGKNQTGIYSGSFYPLNSNPSGYVRTVDTGIFVGDNETGAYTNTFVTHTQSGTSLVGKNQTGIYSGSFYPLNSNPAGYITGSTGDFVTAAETGALLVGKDITGIFHNNLVDTEEENQVYIPGLSFGGVEGEQSSIWGGFISNGMTNWTRRGGKINTSMAGAVTLIDEPEYTVEPNVRVFPPQSSRMFTEVVRTGAGTARFEFTGLEFTVPAHAVWQPFMVSRSSTSVISGLGVELLNNSNVWENVFSGAPSFSGMIWGGPVQTFTGYPVKGVRFSVQYHSAGTGSHYIAEFGLWNKNYVKGSNLYAFQYGDAHFADTNISGVLTATGVIVSGASVVTTSQTGALQNSFVSYAETGAFYPRSGNPSGFLRPTDTGILVGKNETGIFDNTFISHAESGSFYPRVGNPSGYLTGSTGGFVDRTTTGIYSGSFYPLTSNPSGYVRTVDTGIFVGDNETGAYTNTFPTHTQTGTLLVGKNQTGFFTGEFYPYKSNPSGYITSADLSSYVLDSETGAYTNTFPTHTQTGTLLVGKNQTGIYSGSFYPLNSNPSGYLTSGGTGAFYPKTGGQVDGAISGENLISNKYGFGGGVYTFSKTIAGNNSSNVFSVVNSGGAQIMDVMVNCSASGFSAAKSYSVAHAYGTTPLAQLKISTTISGAQDFNSEFFLTGAVSGLAMKINNVGTLSGNFLVTLLLGASPTPITMFEL
jgi:hypothetical protein